MVYTFCPNCFDNIRPDAEIPFQRGCWVPFDPSKNKALQELVIGELFLSIAMCYDR